MAHPHQVLRVQQAPVLNAHWKSMEVRKARFPHKTAEFSPHYREQPANYTTSVTSLPHNRLGWKAVKAKPPVSLEPCGMGMVGHAGNPSNRETEAGGLSQVGNQPGMTQKIMNEWINWLIINNK